MIVNKTQNTVVPVITDSQILDTPTYSADVSVSPSGFASIPLTVALLMETPAGKEARAFLRKKIALHKETGQRDYSDLNALSTQPYLLDEDGQGTAMRAMLSRTLGQAKHYGDLAGTFPDNQSIEPRPMPMGGQTHMHREDAYRIIFDLIRECAPDFYGQSLMEERQQACEEPLWYPVDTLKNVIRQVQSTYTQEASFELVDLKRDQIAFMWSRGAVIDRDSITITMPGNIGVTSQAAIRWRSNTTAGNQFLSDVIREPGWAVNARTYVIGPQSLAMAQIERLLIDNGNSVVRAATSIGHDGSLRVSPDNAMEANGVLVNGQFVYAEDYFHQASDICAINTGMKGGWLAIPPDQESIDADDREEPQHRVKSLVTRPLSMSADEMMETGYLKATPLGQIIEEVGEQMTERMRYLIAGEFNLHAAYQGELGGVKPESFRIHRIGQHAVLNRISFEAMESRLDRAMRSIDEATQNPEHCITVESRDDPIAIMPHKPRDLFLEAAAIMGVPVVIQSKNTLRLYGATCSEISDWVFKVSGDSTSEIARSYHQGTAVIDQNRGHAEIRAKTANQTQPHQQDGDDLGVRL